MIKFFTNKIFIIILLLFAVLFNLASVCFASNIEYNLSNDLYSYTLLVDSSLINSYDYYCFIFIVNSNSDYCCVSTYFSNEPFIFNAGHGKLLSSSENGFYGIRHSFTFSDLSFPYFDNVCFSADDLLTYSSDGTAGYTVSYISSHDILDTNNNVVFQGAPAQEEQQQGETQGIQTLTLEQAEQIPQAMTQTLQVVIPVGLVVFGIGLVIYLVRFLILRLT